MNPLTVRGLMHQASAKPAAIIEIAASPLPEGEGIKD